MKFVLEVITLTTDGVEARLYGCLNGIYTGAHMGQVIIVKIKPTIVVT